MSDSPPERNSNSKSNLIEVQHVGVTAKLQSPLKSVLPESSSSTEADHQQRFSHDTTNVNSKYNQFKNATDSHADTESTTDTSKVLYEMRTRRCSATKSAASKNHATPSKIEFQLYNKQAARRGRGKANNCKRKSTQRRLFEGGCGSRRCKHRSEERAEPTLLQRLRSSLEGMKCSTRRSQANQSKNNNIIFDDLPEPNFQREREQQQQQQRRQQSAKPDTRIGIYPFEHGCADYLRTTDCHPNIISIVLADRATRYATRFWAEFFGTLHIGVAFVIAFLLQSYRFLLYALVNTLLVGFLHMTSDYLVKPILTVAFNGFLQPPLILVFNVFTSFRDILEPIADTVNNFLKPVGNVLKGVRLVHATYNNRKIARDV